MRVATVPDHVGDLLPCLFRGDERGNDRVIEARARGCEHEVGDHGRNVIAEVDCTSVPAGTNTSHFCDRRVEAEMKKALAVEANEPAAAGEAWAGVDRSIVDRAPWLAMPTQLQVYFVSARTSNVQVNLQWGMLLSQLWIH